MSDLVVNPEDRFFMTRLNYNFIFQAVGQSASYAPSEQISDYYDAVMGDDAYTASVDIDDLVRIADSGSDVSGGLISQIDWDEVENLIADVSYN